MNFLKFNNLFVKKYSKEIDLLFDDKIKATELLDYELLSKSKDFTVSLETFDDYIVSSNFLLSDEDRIIVEENNLESVDYFFSLSENEQASRRFIIRNRIIFIEGMTENSFPIYELEFDPFKKAINFIFSNNNHKVLNMLRYKTYVENLSDDDILELTLKQPHSINSDFLDILAGHIL